MIRNTLLTGAAALFLAMPAWAEIEIHDAYARSSSPTAKVGAAFMMIHNHGGADDRLIGVLSDAAKRVELHTHVENDGVMRMMHVEEGFALPADGALHLKRGGKHVMLMGLTAPMIQGETVSITLRFENAGDVVVEVPVDLERQDHNHGHGHNHGSDN